MWLSRAHASTPWGCWDEPFSCCPRNPTRFLKGIARGKEASRRGAGAVDQRPRWTQRKAVETLCTRKGGPWRSQVWLWRIRRICLPPSPKYPRQSRAPTRRWRNPQGPWRGARPQGTARRGRPRSEPSRTTLPIEGRMSTTWEINTASRLNPSPAMRLQASGARTRRNYPSRETCLRRRVGSRCSR